MRPRETPGLEKWRDASQGAVATARYTADLFIEYLVCGGPDAIKALQATIRKLQHQLEEQKADGRLERYRKLQKDLEECDKVRSSLREALVSSQWSDGEVDAYLTKKLFKASQLYGASRELLLKENRLLRAQLEDHLVTTRTSRVAGTGTLGRAAVPESRLKQARMMQGPHMESVARLLDAAESLDGAERAYKLPSVCHAEMQADDGSRKYIQTLEQQMATVVGQKLQLMSQVASLTEQNRVLDMKLEGALDQVSEMRRQKTEMLAHADNISKDIRDHLLSEAKRADVAETSLAEARLIASSAREAAEAARQRMEAALAESQAMQVALQEKTEQVDTLRGLYLELRETLEKLAGDVTTGQQDMARLLLDATREQLLDQKVLLEDVKVATDGTHRAAQHGSEAVTDLSSVQRALVTEVVQQRETTLGAYERQLGVLASLLQQSEVDRVRLARQAIAASALNRIEDKRHEKTVQLLLHEVPYSVVGRLAPELGALAEGAQQMADELDRTNDTLAAAGILVPGKAGPGPGPDLVDDGTTRMLGDSKLLRSQLHSLAAGAPGPPLEGAGAQTLMGSPSPYTAGLFRQLPPGMAPLQHIPPPPMTMLSPLSDPFSGGAGGEVAVAWFPPGAVPHDGGGLPGGYPAAPSYISGPRAVGRVGPTVWDDAPYIDQFQYPYQDLQPVGMQQQPMMMQQQPMMMQQQTMMTMGGGRQHPMMDMQPMDMHQMMAMQHSLMMGGQQQPVAHLDLVLQLEHLPGMLAQAEAGRLLSAGGGIGPYAGPYHSGWAAETHSGWAGDGAPGGGPGAAWQEDWNQAAPVDAPAPPLGVLPSHASASRGAAAASAPGAAPPRRAFGTGSAAGAQPASVHSPEHGSGPSFKATRDAPAHEAQTGPAATGPPQSPAGVAHDGAASVAATPHHQEQQVRPLHWTALSSTDAAGRAAAAVGLVGAIPPPVSGAVAAATAPAPAPPPSTAVGHRTGPPSVSGAQGPEESAASMQDAVAAKRPATTTTAVAVGAAGRGVGAAGVAAGVAGVPASSTGSAPGAVGAAAGAVAVAVRTSGAPAGAIVPVAGAAGEAAGAAGTAVGAAGAAGATAAATAAAAGGVTTAAAGLAASHSPAGQGATVPGPNAGAMAAGAAGASQAASQAGSGVRHAQGAAASAAGGVLLLPDVMVRTEWQPSPALRESFVAKGIQL